MVHLDPDSPDPEVRRLDAEGRHPAAVLAAEMSPVNEEGSPSLEAMSPVTDETSPVNGERCPEERSPDRPEKDLPSSPLECNNKLIMSEPRNTM